MGVMRHFVAGPGRVHVDQVNVVCAETARFKKPHRVDKDRSMSEPEGRVCQFCRLGNGSQHPSENVGQRVHRQ